MDTVLDCNVQLPTDSSTLLIIFLGFLVAECTNVAIGSKHYWLSESTTMTWTPSVSVKSQTLVSIEPTLNTAWDTNLEPLIQPLFLWRFAPKVQRDLYHVVTLMFGIIMLYLNRSVVIVELFILIHSRLRQFSFHHHIINIWHFFLL